MWQQKCCFLKSSEFLLHVFDIFSIALILDVSGTLQSESGTVICNSEASTMVDSDLGTMVINESEEEDDGTMKRTLRSLLPVQTLYLSETVLSVYYGS